MNSIRKIREANRFYDMNYNREVVDKIINYLYTFYSYDMGLLKCNIFKIMEEIQDLKEKIDIELENINDNYSIFVKSKLIIIRIAKKIKINSIDKRNSYHYYLS